jgi:Fe(3+) dicitrate transport protein
MKFKYNLILLFLISFIKLNAQDQPNVLKEVYIKGYKTVNGIGHLPDTKDGIIFAGKKTELILIDSLDANKAINNTRQILGRIPGLNIVETESSGFTANGIATRGLNPSQSIEMNTRQNGYNISADIYGYNEAYYLPPMEAVNRIEFIRGAASLQFGSQFGGMVNYVIKDAPKKPMEVMVAQTLGSYGLFNSFNSVGGTINKFSYYGFLQYRYMEGYRENSQQSQISGFGKINYKANSKLNLGLEYSLLRNKVHMPGGLSDDQFNTNPQQSTRARNWIKSPWNILTGTLNYNPNENTTFSVKTNFLYSNRSLVWRNEDGGPSAVDNIDPVTGTYVPREVENEDMRNITTEIRGSHNYNLLNQKSTLAGGFRQSYAWFNRQGGGEGTTGSDFDLSYTGNFEKSMNFTTTNFAPFVENIFKLSNSFSITPGMRLEYLKSTAKGYSIVDGDKLLSDAKRTRTFTLLGVGSQYKISRNTNLYGNISQVYRPIDYGQIEPFGVTSKIDPNLKDSKGYNSDLGYRGTIKNYLNFDISGFYMAYNNRIGVTLESDPVTGDLYSIRKNIANSVHKGIESYVEFNFIKYFNPNSTFGLSIFDSYSYIDARYTNGEFKGKRVETATKYINRIGLNFSARNFSTTFQINQVGDAFGDASNAVTSDNPVAGYIPAYQVIDWSTTYQYQNFAIKLGCNNLTNKDYFTRRTDEYPGPGIIPAIGRSLYIGFNAKF